MNTLKIGITGQSGFIGTHLAHYLSRMKEEVHLIPFEDAFFESDSALGSFVSRCDCIVHLAAVNRDEEQALYLTNLTLIRKLIAALQSSGNRAHIVFASSTQESRNNPYGRSKQEGRKLLETWAETSGGRVTSLIIPNVFGPFGKPFYNSVVGTFCYQLTHHQIPTIHIDADLELICVTTLVRFICENAMSGDGKKVSVVRVPPMAVRKVSDILQRLQVFQRTYLEKGIMPALSSEFDSALFGTFHSYIDYSYFPVRLEPKHDGRGYLVEVIKSLNGGQAYMSVTRPNIIRGNHFHTRKVERFCVLSGRAMIRLRRIGSPSVTEYPVSGDQPSYVDIPVLHSHTIENTGATDLTTLFWSNELFDPADPDTYEERV
jgi:UDP-2-acetamido-2,6-beta-L-arabino-hexul-4-ose reductase